MKIKKYSDFLKEDNDSGFSNKNNTIRAIYLISKKGEIVEKSGYIILGDGIYDEDKKSWVGAIGEDMRLYTTIRDTNGLFITTNSDKYNQDNNTFTEEGI